MEDFVKYCQNRVDGVETCGAPITLESVGGDWYRWIATRYCPICSQERRRAQNAYNQYLHRLRIKARRRVAAGKSAEEWEALL